MSGIVEQDAQDTNMMIIDVEKMFFWNRNKGEDCYFYCMDYATENTGDWKSQVQFVTSFISGAQKTMQLEIISVLTEQNKEMKELVKAVLNTEQDHFDTSRKIKKNIDNYFVKR